MSFLQFLLDDSPLTYSQLVWDVEEIESREFLSEVTDSQLVSEVEKFEDSLLWDDVSDMQLLWDVTLVEQQVSFDNELTDSECVHACILAEEMEFDQFGISNE